IFKSKSPIRSFDTPPTRWQRPVTTPPFGRKYPDTNCKDRWTKRGGELGLFQFLKQSKATLTYAMLVGHQFTNRITKLPTQTKRDKTKVKPSKVELSYDL